MVEVADDAVSGPHAGAAKQHLIVGFVGDVNSVVHTAVAIAVIGGPIGQWLLKISNVFHDCVGE